MVTRLVCTAPCLPRPGAVVVLQASARCRPLVLARVLLSARCLQQALAITASSARLVSSAAQPMQNAAALQLFLQCTQDVPCGAQWNCAPSGKEPLARLQLEAGCPTEHLWRNMLLCFPSELGEAGVCDPVGLSSKALRPGAYGAVFTAIRRAKNSAAWWGSCGAGSLSRNCVTGSQT